MPKFPKMIFVRWEGDGKDESFMMAANTPDGEDGEKVAIYELQKVKTMKIVESLV